MSYATTSNMKRTIFLELKDNKHIKNIPVDSGVKHYLKKSNFNIFNSHMITEVMITKAKYFLTIIITNSPC